MRYAYLLTHKKGIQMFVVRDMMIDPKAILQVYEKDGYKKCKFYSIIPAGFHLCGCGKVTVGTDDDLLCHECAAIYGHRYAHEL